MDTNIDPGCVCAQAIALGLRTIGGWMRWPVQRGAGVATTLGTAAGALAIFALLHLRRHMGRRAVARAL